MLLTKIFAFFCIFFLSAAYARESHLSQDLFSNALEKIIANESFCVKDYIEDKIYLRENTIYSSLEGLQILVNEEGECVVVPQVSYDGYGYFVKNHQTMENSVEILNRCPHCKERYFIRCKNPDCPINKDKK